MPNFDWRCQLCGHEFEAFVASFQTGDATSCPSCKRFSAGMIWKKAPGMSPDPFWAGHYDEQLGANITSRGQRDRLLEERGLTMVSKAEFTKKAESAAVGDGMADPPLDRAALHEAAQSAWAEVQKGYRVPAARLDEPIKTDQT